jgi:hypothetical protein
VSGEDAGFLARWSRRKVSARQSPVAPEPAADTQPVAATPAATATPPPLEVAAGSAASRPVRTPPDDAASPVAPARAEPPPTLADVALLTRDSDFTRFVAPGVDSQVKNAALKTLFGDPHFNVMDGLDTYIDDYGKPDPLPPGVARQLMQSGFLGLLDPEPEALPVPQNAASPTAAPIADAPPPSACSAESPSPAHDEDADLRLQPHDAAGCSGSGPGAAADGAGQL